MRRMDETARTVKEQIKKHEQEHRCYRKREGWQRSREHNINRSMFEMEHELLSINEQVGVEVGGFGFMDIPYVIIIQIPKTESII